MPDPVTATGAVRNPTRYGALGMGARQFTGLWTQRSPYRDADVPYLISKFYSGSRFDSMIDGLNREISADLTDVRSPGSAVYNGNAFPAAYSFYDWAYLQNSAQTIKLLYDGKDGNIYDATAGQKSTLFTKSANAGQATFQSVNDQVFFGDGADQQKLMQGSQTWQPSANVLPGQLIVEGAAPGKVQIALGGITMSIVAVEVVAALGLNNVYLYVDQQNVPNFFTNLENVNVTLSGFTVATGLNGMTVAIADIYSTTLGIFHFKSNTPAVQVYTADTGSATTGSGTTGATVPTFSAVEFDVVQDSGQQWKCYGPALQNWGVAKPLSAPTLTGANGTRFWQPNALLGPWYAVLDTNRNVEVAINLTNGSTVYRSGPRYPIWVTGSAYGINETVDGTIIWFNAGAIGAWAAATPFYFGISQGTCVILDSNQNLQMVTNGSGANSGATQPSWASVIGTHTTDGGLTWTCLGPGVIIDAASTAYAYSYHAVDGSVSTASATATIQGGVLGMTVTMHISEQELLDVNGVLPYPVADTQIDQIYIWKTPVGQLGTLIFEDAIPADKFASTGAFLYREYGIPDTSASGDGALNAFILAPVAELNNPPPVGFRPLCFAYGGVWGALNNTVVYSNGDATVVGNPNTAFNPLNTIPFVGTPFCIVPITVQNGGLLVFTSNGIWIVFGTGTSTNPFYATSYYASVNVNGYNAVTLFNTTMFVIESNLKVSAIQVQYPFNPQSGYTEVGFPIGDQFKLTTTGGFDASIFNSASAMATWNNQSTNENALYISNAAGQWFRMTAISPPETGYMWSPVRSIEGGASAVQSCVTAPGVTNLLIAPATSGPILMRDTTGTVYTDNGTAYPAYDAKGVNLLCSTGQWADVAHISAKSRAVGARPTVSVLLNEIEPIPAEGVAYAVLTVMNPDPTMGRKTKSVFSNRYPLAQNGVDANGDCILVKFDYGSQTVADELLDWGILASVHDEREEQAAK